MGICAFLFPGQASQYPGMGRDLHDKFPTSRAAFEEADRALGFSLSKICFEGTEDELKLTTNTQPAILTVSVAAFRVLAEKGITGRAIAIIDKAGKLAWFKQYDIPTVPDIEEVAAAPEKDDSKPKRGKHLGIFP